MKPKFRKEAELDLNGAIQSAIWTQFHRLDMFPFRSCINCLNFKEDQEICVLANQRPPAKVIVFGCPMHVDIKDIPF